MKIMQKEYATFAMVRYSLNLSESAPGFIQLATQSSQDTTIALLLQYYGM